MIDQGGTIGILGGGQLGRMLAMAAAALGYRCHVFTPERDSVAGEVSHQTTCSPWTDDQAIRAFADDCDVITLEFENVPVAPLGPLAAKLFPGVRALEIAQDRLNEKRFVTELGGKPAPFHPVESQTDLAEAIERIGVPGILKTRRDGYDGKGQWRIRSARDAEAIRLPSAPTVYEGFVEFEAEFSVILARGHDGAIRYWDSSQNVHEGGILARSSLPAAPIIVDQVEEARELAAKVASALDYVGVLTLEFFATSAGPIFNEMAPRVHNSGHWTIEGAATSQFANHIRAICGLPLGITSLVARELAMDNVIGPDIERALERLRESDTHVHIYGKKQAVEGRKMGHVTRLVR
ncbi:5-(carboxyamino)imidazole ribonucleotide synthase [Altererythrobacter sp. MF3-039]|uniref:5-(carboxyamino)imidazole ribonucleotide synthase n=1 Tax=Altererythrobacter sp. MF3-039 TaxID=3252901 RepID=UPI00390C53C4